MKKKSFLSQMDFPAMERRLLDQWYSRGIVKKYLQKNTTATKRFSFLDGPITANNPMGVHHAWGRTLKDVIQRYKNMQGFCQRFQNGFDCQGLWVEVEVEKELGLKTKKDIENLVPGSREKSIAKFVTLCKKRVLKFARIQTEQSKRLGYFMDWDHSYYTMSDENNETIWTYLKICHEKGWLYKGRDSVPWCPRCGTAISQHEILSEEYQPITHTAVYVKLPLLERKDTSLLIWTTTPWTLPANVAAAIDPKKAYVLVEDPEDKDAWLVVLKSRVAAIFGPRVKTKPAQASALIGQAYQGIFDDLPAVKKTMGSHKHVVITADPRMLTVSEEEGTGIVHIAPGAGAEDFALGKKENLPVLAPIDESATYVPGYGELTGHTVQAAVPMITSLLKEKDVLFKKERYRHRYPTCWRCKEELVWRVVDEWYIAMDKKDNTGRTYRAQMIDVAKKIRWIPAWGLDRELDWLKNMHDWLISKKRYWGLALPIWECFECHSFEVIGTFAELKKKAISGWEEFEGHSPHRPWIDRVTVKCSICGRQLSRIPDVGNPWLDAGIVPYSTLGYLSDRKRWARWFPADFVTEAFPGQFKNWFYALIAMSTVMTGRPPFTTLLGHALVRDDKGEEMHKSKGNAIEFNDAAASFGADVMRWLYCMQNPELNVNFGPKSIGETRRRFYLLYWNTFQFFRGYADVEGWTGKEQKNLHKFPLTILDQWILSRLATTIENSTVGLDAFDTVSAARAIEAFVQDLSTWYVRRSRARIGPTAGERKDKETCYRVLFFLFEVLNRLTAPMIPYLSDEMYTYLTGEHVHTAEWPSRMPSWINARLEQEMAHVRTIVEEGHRIRKEKKIKVRQPLASLTYCGRAKLSVPLEKLIADELNVKGVHYSASKTKTSVLLDTKLTPALCAEGEAREIIRSIQQERKKAGVRLDDRVAVTLPDWPKEFEEMIKQQTLTSEISRGDHLTIRRQKSKFQIPKSK